MRHMRCDAQLKRCVHESALARIMLLSYILLKEVAVMSIITEISPRPLRTTRPIRPGMWAAVIVVLGGHRPDERFSATHLRAVPSQRYPSYSHLTIAITLNRTSSL